MAKAGGAAGCVTLEQRAHRAILLRKVVSKATKLESPEIWAKNWARFHRVLHLSHNTVGSVVLLGVLFCCIQKPAQISSCRRVLSGAG
jgi:hypothetical protein